MKKKGGVVIVEKERLHPKSGYPHAREEFSMEFDIFEDRLLVMRYKRLARRLLFHEPWSLLKVSEGAIDSTDANLADEILKFVILMVENEGNPLAEYKDFAERKNIAIQYIKGEYSGVVLSMWNTQHYWMLAVVTEYLKVIDNEQFAMWVSSRIKFYRDCELLRQSIPPDENAGSWLNAVEKISQSLPRQLEDIRKLELLLFSDSTVRKMAVEAQADNFGGWAERFADDFVPAKR